jgi:hypothetical protein
MLIARGETSKTSGTSVSFEVFIIDNKEIEIEGVKFYSCSHKQIFFNTRSIDTLKSGLDDLEFYLCIPGRPSVPCIVSIQCQLSYLSFLLKNGYEDLTGTEVVELHDTLSHAIS